MLTTITEKGTSNFLTVLTGDIISGGITIPCNGPPIHQVSVSMLLRDWLEEIHPLNGFLLES